MGQALRLAKKAYESQEVPIGAVLIRDDQILARGHNQTIGLSDPTAHAEILAMRYASTEARNYRLPGSTLYVTVEPCMMCVGAMVHARVQRLVFGALESKAGAVISHSLIDKNFLNHQINFCSGVLERECGKLMTDFFSSKR
jgi:tRNA(adenine34) deaminase